jgi:hypothetical protein
VRPANAVSILARAEARALRFACKLASGLRKTHPAREPARDHIAFGRAALAAAEISPIGQLLASIREPL